MAEAFKSGSLRRKGKHNCYTCGVEHETPNQLARHVVSANHVAWPNKSPRLVEGGVPSAVKAKRTHKKTLRLQQASGDKGQVVDD